MINVVLAGVIGAAIGYLLGLWVVRPDLDIHCEHCSCERQHD
jgi:uncharacterized metal-binding protein